MTTKLPWVPDPEDLKLTCVSEDITDEKSLVEFLDVLAEHPGQRVAWSKHQSRGAARQRINVLKKSARFRGRPQVRFETKSERPRDTEAGVYILVSWDHQQQPPLVEATEVETEHADRLGLDPDTFAMHVFMMYGKHLEEKMEERVGPHASAQKRAAHVRRLVDEVADAYHLTQE